MENPKPLETLEVENPDEKIPNEASGSFSMNEIFSGLASVSDISNDFGYENVELETQVVNQESLGCESKHDHLVKLEPEKVNEVFVETQAVNLEPGKVNEVCSETQAVVPQAEKVNEACIETQEAEKVNEVWVETQAAKPEAEKINETLTQVVNEENPTRAADLSKSGFNENVTEEARAVEPEKVNLEKVNAENEKVGPSEGISLYVDISGGQGNGTDDKDSSFSIGDIVWARTRDIAWWPGKIVDPAGAPAKKKTTAGGGEGNLLVSYYGITHLARCSPSQLRPFRESFEEMSVTSKTRIFLGAVQSAMDEFGRVEESGRSELGGFDPAGFLRRVRCLSVTGSMPCALDFAVTRSRLSAFYRSLGHKQLPIELLSGKKKKKKKKNEQSKDGTGSRGKTSSGSRKRKTTKNEEEEETKTKFDSRERKKSRYLSYPYVNFEQRGHSSSAATTNNSKNAPQKVVALEASNIGGEKFWREWRSSFSAAGAAKETKKNSAPAKLLRGLRSAAIKGLDPDESKGFSPTGWFFSRYRVSTYRDESPDDTCPKIATPGPNEGVVNGAETSDDQPIKSLILKKSKKKKKKKKKENQKEVIGETVSEVAEKEEKNNNPGMIEEKPLSGLSETSIGAPALLSPCDKPKQRAVKIGEEENSVVDRSETEPKTVLPDLNGSCNPSPNPTVTNINEGKKTEVANINEGKKTEVAVNLLQAPPPEPSGNNFRLLDKDGETITVFPGQRGKSTPKKRKKEKKEEEKDLPDLNAVNGVSPDAVKAERRKRRRKEKPVALSYPRNQSFSGTAALVLTFAPGAPAPTREDLVSAFAKFGELRESETRVSTESGGGGGGSGSARVVFANSSGGAEAFRSLEKGGENSNPFGAGLVSYRLHQVPETRPPPPLPPPAPAPAAVEVKLPPLDLIKQNLEMMTMMLEKSGDDLSKEMRAKLEGEIKGLLGKVSSMAGSCSS